jgi:hypothetical protein
MSSKKYTEEKIKEDYIKLYNKLQRTPRKIDINEAFKEKEICSYDTILYYFGTLRNLQKTLGYEINLKARQKYKTKDYITNCLINIYNENGGRIDKIDLRKYKDFSRLSQIYKIMDVHSFEEMWEQLEKNIIK